MLAFTAARQVHAFICCGEHSVVSGVAVALLVVQGRAACRASELHGEQLEIVTVMAGALGVVMILLKEWPAPLAS